MPFEFENLQQRAVESPLNLIHDFINQLEKLLGNILQAPIYDFDFTLDIGEDLDNFRAAYKETLPAFGRVRDTLGSDEVAGNLQHVGLTDNSLIAKFSVLESYSKHLRKGFKKAIKYIFDMANQILGSLKAAAGTGGLAVDMIQELKDVIKTKIEFMNAW